MKASKKLAVVAGTSALAIAGVGVGYAYFSGGSGTGTCSAATTSSASGTLSTSAALNSGTISLDGQPNAIDITVTNSHPYSLSWTSTSVAITALPTDCPAGSYVVTPPSDDVSGTVGPKVDTTDGTTTVDSGYTIKFVDLGTGTNQDACLTGSVSLSSGVSST